MKYIFDIELATTLGVDEAIMIENLIFWITKNKANGVNFYDGRYWTYNTMTAFQNLFPFWTMNQIRRILDSLVSKGVIIKGNYNKSAYDRTIWYAFVDEEKYISICAKPQMELCKTTNGSVQNHGPIPYINTDIINTPNFSNSVCSQTEEDVSFVVEKKTGVDEPDNAGLVKQDRKNPLNNIPAYLLDIPLVEKTLQKKSYYPAGFEVFWAVYPRTDGKKAAFKAWKKLEKEGISLENVLKHTKEYVSSVREIKYMKHASSFLNQWDFHSDDKIEHITEEVLKEWVEWL